MTFPRILAAVGLLVPSLAMAQPQPAVVGSTVERTAIVESVNTTERSVLLRGEDGTLATLVLGPEARNFAQIRPGDRVVAAVTDAIAVSLARPDGRAAVGSAVAASRTPEGARPGVRVTDAKRVRVRIEGIDLGRNSVAFTRPDGTRGEVRAQAPDMRRFLRTLSPGDEVDVVYIESVSLRVLPPT
jgi:hypothetical protein